MQYPDFEEFIDALNVHGVRYLIVGAHALAHHARPRATKDLDVLIDRTPGNAQRTLDAVSAFFGGADLGYAAEDLTDPDWFIQLGVAPVRIDLLTSLQGCPAFDSLWKDRVVASFGGQQANYLSKGHLIEAKRSAGRPQDLADLEQLERDTPEG